jgi:hypothetical protein
LQSFPNLGGGVDDSILWLILTEQAAALRSVHNYDVPKEKERVAKSCKGMEHNCFANDSALFPLWTKDLFWTLLSGKYERYLAN